MDKYLVELARGYKLRAMRDIDSIGAELRLVTALRRAARERGGPVPSIDVADALLVNAASWSNGYSPTSSVRASKAIEA